MSKKKLMSKFVVNNPVNSLTGQVTGRSWQDGLKTQYKETKMQNKNVEPLLANGDKETLFRINGNSIGHMALSQMLQRELDRLEHDDMTLILKELYDDYFVYYSSSDNQLYKRGYTVKADGNTVELADDVTKVVEKTEYAPTHQQAVRPLSANGDQKLFQANNAFIESQTQVKPMPALGFQIGESK